MQKNFGWLVPDEPLLSSPRIFSASEISGMAEKRSVEDKVLRIKDQFELGSCTGQSATYAFQIVDSINGEVPVEYSALDVYRGARWYINRINEDYGAYLRDALNYSSNFGICLERDWPYQTRKFRDEPGIEILQKRDKVKLVNYEMISSDVNHVRWELCSDHIVVAGFRITEQWQEPGVKVIGPPKGRVIGGHAVTLVGYDHKTKYFRVLNSWGKNWGENGFFWLHYDWLNFPNCGEIHSVRVVRRSI